MKKRKIELKRFSIYIALIIIFFLLMSLSARYNELMKLTEQNNLMQTEVVALLITNNHIETQIAIATSEIAVEQYAREQGYMVKPGEVLIVPISSYDSTPTPVIVAPEMIEAMPNWKIWYELFFSDLN
jgi:cell division protein FtsB